MPTPNFIKYSTTPDSSGIKVGNYTIGVFSGGTYGPTSTTNYWNGVSPPISGYTIYENKSANGPSIRVPSSASVLIDYANRLYSGTGITTEYSALTYLNSLGTVVCVNRDYEEIITSGLTLNLDAGFTPSYPKSGTTWTDISFSGNNGTLTNGPTYNSSNGGSIVFDGVDDYVNIPTTITMGSQNTVIGFIKLSGTNSDTVVFCPEANGVDNWIGIQSNRLFLFATEISDVNNFSIQGTTNLDTSDSVWYQIVSTINNNVATIYLNGVQENSVTKNFTIGSWTSNGNLGRRGGFSQTRYFKGSMSSVQVYNRVLSPTEIVQNYQAQFPRFLGENIVTNGLVFYVDAGYRLSYPTTGTTWSDVSGYGRNGTLTNGPSYSGGSIVFDGVDDYINNIGATSAFTFIQNTAIFTIDVWVKPNLLGTAMYFMGNNDGTTTAKGFYLGKLANNLLWLAITRGVPGQLVLSFQPVNFFTDTNWVNITITCDGTTAIAYKNGTQFTTTTSISTLSTGNSQKSLALGRINDFNTSYWNGNISITRIYNRPLSQTEITQNFNAQKSRFGL